MRYMAHEIRNPTSIVSSGLVILQDKILKEKTLLVEKARERGKEECERVAAYQNISIGMIESEMEIRDSSYSGSNSCSDRERGRDKSDLRYCENNWDLEKTREKGLEMERLKEMKCNSGTQIYGDGEDKVEDHGILHINSLSETIRDIKGEELKLICLAVFLGKIVNTLLYCVFLILLSVFNILHFSCHLLIDSTFNTHEHILIHRTTY